MRLQVLTNNLEDAAATGVRTPDVFYSIDPVEVPSYEALAAQLENFARAAAVTKIAARVRGVSVRKQKAAHDTAATAIAACIRGFLVRKVKVCFESTDTFGI